MPSDGTTRTLRHHGVRLAEAKAVLRGKEYRDWAIIEGRPHRSEFGNVLRRWARRSGRGRGLLVSGPSDRPVGPFLAKLGIEWMDVPDWFTTGRSTPRASWSPTLAGRLPRLAGDGLPNADVQQFGYPLLEQDMELFLAEHPTWLTKVMGERMRLHPAGRQYRIERGRLDLLALDRGGRTCVIECKRGALHASHLGQMMEYFQPNDAVIGNARLVLLLNSSHPSYDEPLARAGIEIRRFPLELLVQGIVDTNFPITPKRRSRGHPTQPAPALPDSGGARDVAEALKDVLPPRVFERLGFKAGYVDPRKVGVLRASDQARVLYVASNQDRLELSTPVLHELLSSGTAVPFRATRSHTVYFNMLPHMTVPLITVDIRSDDTPAWIRNHGPSIRRALERFDENLERAERNGLLMHLGAVFQTHNALKSQADGSCRNGRSCAYCRALGSN